MTQQQPKKPPVCPVSEGSAAATPAAAPALAALMSRHILRDGEVILLVLKPSLWFILFNSLSFIASAVIVICCVKLLGDRLNHGRVLIELGFLLIAARLMWSVLQWMGRLYILTDMRILRIEGVFQSNIFDCPLRKVARTRILRTLREKLLNLGTIEIIPKEESYPIASWQTISRPVKIHEQIVAAINKANQGGNGGA